MTTLRPRQAQRAAAQTPRALAVSKLSESGLPASSMSPLGLDVLSPQEVRALSQTFQQLPSLRFSYLDPRDRTPMRAALAWPP